MKITYKAGTPVRLKRIKIKAPAKKAPAKKVPAVSSGCSAPAEIHERSKDNVRDNGEVFTPTYIVDEMLDLLPEWVWTDPTHCFLEPSCGNGQFLVRILDRRIKGGIKVENALNTLIGLDISKVNIDDSIYRLCEIAAANMTQKPGGKAWFDRAALIYAIAANNIFQVADSIAYIKGGGLADKCFFAADPTGNNQVLGETERRERLKQAKSIVKNYTPFLKNRKPT